jgi:hypothetical protein
LSKTDSKRHGSSKNKPRGQGLSKRDSKRKNLSAAGSNKRDSMYNVARKRRKKRSPDFTTKGSKERRSSDRD